MICRVTVLWVGVLCVLASVVLGSRAVASASGTPQLVISQFKVTSSSGQFVTLYNQSSTTLDLSQFEVDYINSSGKLSSLAVSGQVPAHGYYMLSDGQAQICYQMTLNSMSLGFATTSGSLQIWQLSADKTTKSLQDSVAWASSKPPAGAVLLPTQNSTGTVSSLRQPTDSLGNPQLLAPSGGTWQSVVPDSAHPCTLDILNTTTSTPSPSSNPANQLGTGQAPPSTIVNLASTDSSSAAPMLPPADVGLAAPQITELLPNPDGTGTDDSDEFIELYNPNPAEFHLVGFTLQTGTATKHSYVFPDGTVLSAQSFTAFYSADTSLSLSNSAGQADLLDPFGNTLGQTDPYGTAKDGQTWALADGVWYWTTQATPNAANVIKQVASPTSGKATDRSNKSTSSGAVKGTSTQTSSGGTSTAQSATAGASTPSPIHPYMLAAVAALAVGYGVYEYRHDLGNRLHQWGRNRALRRAARV